MKAVSKPWLALLCTLLTACVTPSPALREGDEPPQVVASWEEGCENERTVVLHAGELIFRFELTGPIVPYYRGRR